MSHLLALWISSYLSDSSHVFQAHSKAHVPSMGSYHLRVYSNEENFSKSQIVNILGFAVLGKIEDIM